MSANFVITATATGASSSVYLAPGEWVLALTSSSWGDADLQASADGRSTFIDVTDTSGVINATANKLVRVAGGLYYRLDVNTFTADIVLTAQRCRD